MTVQGEALVEPRRWLTVLVAGLLLGLAAAVGYRFGVWEYCTTALASGIGLVYIGVGPTVIPMAALWGRVCVLVYRAYSSRADHLLPIQPIRPELSQLAPLFTGLGFAGTVAGYISGFSALEGSDLLAKLPDLLTGVSASMVSTLVGLGLWAATLLLAAYFPVWSWAHIRWDEGDFRVDFDGRSLGRGTPAIEMLAEAVKSREPEALCLAFDRAIPVVARERVATAVWSRRDADLLQREETLP